MNIFNKIKRTKNQRNKFDLSHERKQSLNMGEVIPILLEEIVPTDSFKVSSEILLRMAPMLAPIMHRVSVYTHYFFVPNRIIWDNWETFITGGEDGLQTAPMPQILIDNTTRLEFAKGNLPDYFGIPTIAAGDGTVQGKTNISALPFRAYAEIINEYFRDQNLTPKIAYDKGDIVSLADQSELIKIRKRAWEKDYFTSALPWPQRGAAVNLPVESSFSPQYLPAGSASVFPNVSGPMTSGIAGVIEAAGQPVEVKNLVDPQPVTSTSVTINELRNATRLQEWLEKMARGGSRYAEQLLNMWNSKSSDARLQRPEYLGGGKNPVIISEVLNTAGANSETGAPELAPVGEMSGHGISVGKSNGFTKTFEEHGFVIGLMSVIPRTTYQDGIERSWSRLDKLDYYWPDFAHLGEQEIIQELYAGFSNMANRTATFGYTPRYAEYKYKQSTVHGEFRDTLKYWHMGRKFDTPPALNSEFVESDPTHDIFAVNDPAEDKLYCQIYNSISAVRPMPYYGTPYL